jgi:hypothetical protein
MFPDTWDQLKFDEIPADMLAVPAIRRLIEGDRTPQQLESNAEHHLNNNNDAQPTTMGRIS